LINRARSFIYSTALPAHIVTASIEALNIILNEPSLVKRLWRNRDILAEGLRSLGVDTGSSETPIIPLLLKENWAAITLSRFLLDRGIYAPPVRRPTVKIPRIRITVTAAHTEDDLARLVETLREARSCGLL
jgi:glycine C-acetyltransferase